MKTNWAAAFQISAVYVGTVVGAGFATGREIVEFFSRFGFIGLIGILMSGYIFVFSGTKMMRIAAKIKANSYQDFNNYLFGNYFGPFVNVIILLMLLGVCGVMLAGAGAIFEEQLQLTKFAGILLTIGLSMVVMLVGIQGLFAVNIFIVPMIIIFNIFLAILSVKSPDFLNQFLYIPFADDGWKSVIAPFSYTAFNLGLAQAVLVPVAAEVRCDETIKWGGIIGGIALTIILISSHVTLVMLPELEIYDIPMAVIMKNVAPGLYWVFIIVIYGAIFTSVIGNIFGLERQLKNIIKINSFSLVSIIFFVTYFISLINYGKLLAYLYPLFGQISVIFIILLWMKPFNNS